MHNRPATWLGYALLVLAGLYLTAKMISLSFVVVSVSGSSEGTIEVVKTEIAFAAGNSLRIVPVIVREDSHYLLRCGSSETSFGYLTPRLDFLTLLNIHNCELQSLQTYF